MKIEISNESYEFVKNLIAEIDSQDNRMTANPYYYVIQEEKTRCVAPGCGDDVVYIHDGEGFSKEDMMDVFELETDEEFENFKDANYIEEVEIVREHDDAVQSNVFFTEKACHRHIELNHYHFRDPRSYVKHAWRNPEVEGIIKALREIAESK